MTLLKECARPFFFPLITFLDLLFLPGLASVAKETTLSEHHPLSLCTPASVPNPPGLLLLRFSGALSSLLLRKELDSNSDAQAWVPRILIRKFGYVGGDSCMLLNTLSVSAVGVETLLGYGL